MLDEKSQEVSRLLLVLDMLLTLIVWRGVQWFSESYSLTHHVDILPHLSLIVFVWLPLAYFMLHFGAYQGLRVRSISGYVWIVFKALGASVAILLTFLFLLDIEYISRTTLIAFGVLTFLALVTVRAGLVWWYFRRSVEKGENFLKVLVIGTGERAERLTETLRSHSEWGIDLIGYLDPDQARVGGNVLGAPVLGTVDEIESILASQVVDEVILAVPRSLMGDMDKIVSACDEQGVKFRWMADVFDLNVARTRLVDLGGLPILTFEPVAQNETDLLIKRLFDMSITLLCFPVLIPLFAMIAVAIKLDSPGPVFFFQDRVGLRKRVFPMWKFRSMYVDAEERLKEIEHLNEADGPIFKIANDPRVTRVGSFLRKTSLDEIPQLLNVIRGHMSLVGPRPMSLRDVGLFDRAIQRKRFSVRPGLTCIWQVSGRSNLPFEKWLELDLEYIDNWSLWLDLKILFRTIPVVLKGSGAV